MKEKFYKLLFMYILRKLSIVIKMFRPQIHKFLLGHITTWRHMRNVLQISVLYKG